MADRELAQTGEKAEPKMTPWFSGGVKPVRTGVYERKLRILGVNGIKEIWDDMPTPATWDGIRWRHQNGNASLYQPYIGGGLDFQWRGIGPIDDVTPLESAK